MEVHIGDTPAKYGVAHSAGCCTRRRCVLGSLCGCCCGFLLLLTTVLAVMLLAGDGDDDAGAAGSPEGETTMVVKRTVYIRRPAGGCGNSSDMANSSVEPGGNISCNNSSSGSASEPELIALEVEEEVSCPYVAAEADGCPRGDVNVTIDAVDGKKGNMRVLLFATEDAWKSDSRYRGAQAEATVSEEVTAAGSMTIALRNVLHHEYAIFGHHDSDKDDRLDSIFGFPREGVTASNNAQGGPSGGPKWREAKFVHDRSLTTLDMGMWYP
eukprot:TRINITY_DN14517_c0_g1_i1.p1 TRINITY_DN14517_c0_g1~~TRINITY_DN14517_c0_g1_i1.p1  ORF type:complete len:269 (-),score=57.65 TRINITY_DN14517_c0_g1_i1:424-1230(-)